MSTSIYKKFNFICHNKKCDKKNQIQNIYAWDNEVMHTSCECGILMQYVQQEAVGMVPIINGDPKRIQKLLQKRSHDHFRKEGREMKREANRFNGFSDNS